MKNKGEESFGREIVRRAKIKVSLNKLMMKSGRTFVRNESA